MPVHVNGVGVAAVVVEQKPVARALPDREQGIGIRPRFAVDGPPIVAAAAAWYLLEGEADGFIGRFSWRPPRLAPYMKVQVRGDIPVIAKTVADLCSLSTWPPGLILNFPQPATVVPRAS